MGSGVAELPPRGKGSAQHRPQRRDQKQTHRDVEDAQAPWLGQKSAQRDAEPGLDRDAGEVH